MFGILDLERRKIGVLGFGKSGQAVVKLLSELGACVKVSEKKRIEEMDIEGLPSGVEFEIGKHTLEFFEDVDLIITSPGIPVYSEIISLLVKAGKPIYTEFEIALRFLKRKKVIAITGTNGKSTVVKLLETIFHKAGLHAVACGNIGVPVSEIVLSGRDPQYIILEISSFQLCYSKGFAPDVGVFLNFGPDHLDYHTDLDEYREAKWRLFKFQDPTQWAVLNRKIIEEKRIKELKARVIPFGIERDSNFPSGGFVRKGSVWVNICDGEEKICRVEDVPLSGTHNIENVVASAVVGRIMGIPIDIIEESIRGFKGLPYRIQEIGLIDGVRFINDSKSTNVDSTIAAIDSFDSPIVLILGGIYKGGEIYGLKETIKKRVKHVILFGESKDLFLKSLLGIVPITLANSLEEVVKNAIRYTSEGDIILFSPACSSFDMFGDYVERGEEFNKVVWSLVERGTEEKCVC